MVQSCLARSAYVSLANDKSVADCPRVSHTPLPSLGRINSHRLREVGLMSRARSLKPGFFKNEDLAECTSWARLCFAGLWTLADRDGRLEDRPKRIKAELFAFDSIEVEPLLVELEAHKFVERYQNSDGSFIQISKFHAHQSPHYSEKASVIKPASLPESNGHDPGPTPGAPPETSRSEAVIKRGSQPPSSLTPYSLTPFEEPPHPPAGGVFGFEEFWSEWPNSERKVAREQCESRWRKACHGIEDRVVAAVRAAKESDAWRKDNGAFIPAPLTWLKRASWEGQEAVASVWYETQRGVESKAAEVGLPKWSELEPFDAYRRRVVAEVERAAT